VAYEREGEQVQRSNSCGWKVRTQWGGSAGDGMHMLKVEYSSTPYGRAQQVAIRLSPVFDSFTGGEVVLVKRGLRWAVGGCL
jgi:hypothetical protein